jgi:hypothetical protein
MRNIPEEHRSLHIGGSLKSCMALYLFLWCQCYNVQSKMSGHILLYSFHT